MNNLFSADNKFFTFMSKLFDTVVLNTIWLLLCLPLPVLTIVWTAQTENFYLLFLTAIALLPVVPATTALYYALMKSVRRERSYAIKEYFRSFARNFKQGALFSLFAVLLIVILSVDFEYTWGLVAEQKSSGNVYLGIFIGITFVFCGMYAYICPILSRFEMKTIAIFKTAFAMAARHFLTTILLLVLAVAVLLGCYIITPAMFILPAAATLLASFLIEKVFKRYMPEKEEPEFNEAGEEIGRERDEWYLD